MAGTRLVEDLRALRPDLPITVFGAEPHPPYNRVLLSEVLAGTASVDDLALGEPSDVDVRPGVTVTGIDRDRRLVTASDGSEVRYDALVLATGSEPLLPPIDGLRTDLPGVEAFRTLDDCRRIMGRCASRAIVLGGGLLGLEAARGLHGRGVGVTVVHAAPHLMERQLDGVAGQVLAGTLRRLGIQSHVATSTTQVLGQERFRGLLLADGRRLAADLLVVCCGVRPDAGLARAAGLRVDRGVVVDDGMRSVTDPAVYAIGDCAEHDGQLYGLVGPAWAQAAVAARRISGVDPAARYTSSNLVTRLKACGVELAAMGETGANPADPADPAVEVVQFADPARGTYKKMVIRDDRLVGAILLGDVGTVGTVTALYDRGGPVPPDRLALLFAAPPGGLAVPDDPTLLPDRATICHCNSVSKGAIMACLRGGARSVGAVAVGTRATTGCGGCAQTVAELVSRLSACDPDPEPETATA
jgi:assimilatory nitrate reductase electron transfer subunit